MSLFFEERKSLILDELENNGRVKVVSLAQKFDVSKETIRRDLSILESEGKLKRIYSGAIKVNFEGGEPPFLNRQVINEQEKKAIGLTAAKLVESNSSIFLGSGTTVIELAKVMKGQKNLTILTNSIPVMNVLLESITKNLITGKIILLGGEIDSKQNSTGGLLCLEMLERFSVDKAFISVGGISLTKGLSDYDMDETKITHLSMQAAKQTIVLADHSKIAVDAFVKIASLDEVDTIVSNKKAPQTWKEKMEDYEIDWITSEM